MRLVALAIQLYYQFRYFESREYNTTNITLAPEVRVALDAYNKQRAGAVRHDTNHEEVADSQVVGPSREKEREERFTLKSPSSLPASGLISVFKKFHHAERPVSETPRPGKVHRAKPHKLFKQVMHTVSTKHASSCPRNSIKHATQINIKVPTA